MIRVEVGGAYCKWIVWLIEELPAPKRNIVLMVADYRSKATAKRHAERLREALRREM